MLSEKADNFLHAVLSTQQMWLKMHTCCFQASIPKGLDKNNKDEGFQQKSGYF